MHPPPGTGGCQRIRTSLAWMLCTAIHLHMHIFMYLFNAQSVNNNSVLTQGQHRPHIDKPTGTLLKNVVKIPNPDHLVN